METFTYRYPAGDGLARRARVGVVASADLEILVVPRHDQQSTFTVTTSVDGFGPVWQLVIEDYLAGAPYAADYTLNDAGAHPGTVALRLAQLKELAA